MKRMVRAVARPVSLASTVTQELERLIVENQLPTGGRLPAERDLAQQFGVSRTVIREAVRSLAAKGMLEVRAGSGTSVKTPSAKNLASSITLLLRNGSSEMDYKKVSEVRRVLEVEIAGLAAERRTEEDLERMGAILEQREGIRERRERFVEWDLSFHNALAHATQNQLFPLLLDSVVGTLRTVRELGWDVPATPGKAIRFHEAIFAEVRAGRAEGARKAMREHLSEAELTMRKALALRARREST